MKFTPSQQETADALVHKYEVFDTLTSEHIDAQDLRGEVFDNKLIFADHANLPEGCVLYRCYPRIQEAINVRPAASVFDLNWSSTPIVANTFDRLDMIGAIDGAVFGIVQFMDSNFDSVTWKCEVKESLTVERCTLQKNQISLRPTFGACAAFWHSTLSKCEIDTQAGRYSLKSLRFKQSTLSQVRILSDAKVSDLHIDSCELTHFEFAELTQTSNLHIRESTLKHCKADNIRALEIVLEGAVSLKCTFEIAPLAEGTWVQGVSSQTLFTKNSKFHQCQISTHSECSIQLRGCDLHESILSIRRNPDVDVLKTYISQTKLTNSHLTGGELELEEAEALGCEFEDSRINLRRSSLARCKISNSIIVPRATKDQVKDCTLERVLVFDKALEAQGGTYFGRGSVIENFQISNFEFRNADLSGATLRSSTFKKCTFLAVSFESVIVEGCEFIECTFIGVNFAGAKLRDTKMDHGLLTESPLSTPDVNISTLRVVYTKTDHLESVSYISANAARGSTVVFLDTRCEECENRVDTFAYLEGKELCDDCEFEENGEEDEGSWDA